MPRFTIGLGAALILTGAMGYIMTDAAPASLLIWPLFGAFILVCGVMAATNDDLQTRLLYTATAITAVAFLATVGDVRFVLYMFSVGPEHVSQPGAVIARSIIAILCGAYLYACARSCMQTPPKPAE